MSDTDRCPVSAALVPPRRILTPARVTLIRSGWMVAASLIALTADAIRRVRSTVTRYVVRREIARQNSSNSGLANSSLLSLRALRFDWGLT
ncbi:hypothetical protein [Ornithinimicrobium kibberense]|uniref:hypothetical protein n=1 Tax=Ornithinimicrobium kibberense TaxID=282060 RepID=UPI0036223208